VRRVRFIRRAQDLGFTLGEIADLLALRRQSVSACERVQTRAAATRDRIAEKIRDLERMRTGLTAYITACSRRRPIADCPLLSALDYRGDEAG
jgi:DNA-binding transcriptional MerR regulator